MACENKRMNQWCDGIDVKQVQMKSRTASGNGTNEFKGEILLMCKECRKAHNGQIKLK